MNMNNSEGFNPDVIELPEAAKDLERYEKLQLEVLKMEHSEEDREAMKAEMAALAEKLNLGQDADGIAA